MLKKLYAVLMSLFLTMTVLPQSIYAEEETEEEETTEETAETEEIEEEEVIPEEITEEEEPAEIIYEETEEENPEETIPEETVVDEEDTETEEVVEEVIPETEKPVIEMISEEESEDVTEETPEEDPVIEKNTDEQNDEIIEDTVDDITNVEADSLSIENAEQIHIDTEKRISGKASECVYLKFIPETTGIYSIYSYNSVSCGPYAVLLNANGEILVDSNEYDGIGNNFKFNMRFDEGETVYISASEYEGEAFTYSIKIEYSNHIEDNFIYSYSYLNNKIAITEYIGNDTDVVIPSEIYGYPVFSIAQSAFYNCSSITSITIPETITSLGHSAFEGCTGLESITIPDSVTRIEPYTFEGCINLIEITIPEGVKIIGDYAFSNCRAINNMLLPSSVTTIGNEAFSECGGLTSITIPEGVTEINDGLFKNCRNLTDITISNNITKIGAYAFLNCINLISLTIPETVTSIGNAALGYYETDNNVAGIIDGFVIYGNKGSEAETYAKRNNIEFVATDVSVYDDFEYLVNEGRITIAQYVGSETAVVIPSEIEGLSVTEIGVYAFYNCSSVTNIEIPDCVTTIGEYAFYNCIGLTSITIPDSVINIKDAAFWGCRSLNKVIIPDSVTSVGRSVFYSCSLQTAGPVGSGSDYEYGWTTDIPDNAFQYCSNLTSIMIPDSVTSIGNGVFSYCSSLVYITIPFNVTSIGNYAFNGCSNLANITIPDSVTSIGDYAFESCRSLANITIPDSVTSIGNYVFNGCSNLANITIPDSVTSIGDYAFASCSSLVNITIPFNVTSIGNYAFNGCSDLANITIPDSVTSIGREAFANCDCLKTAGPIGSGANYEFGWTTTIPDNAFDNCDFAITIPDSVTSIGKNNYGLSMTIIGYPGSTAEKYAKNLDIRFVTKAFDIYGDFECIKDNSEIIIANYIGSDSEVIIPAVIDDLAVTSIRLKAFEKCGSVKSIIIPDSITSIGDRTFRNCSNLESITMSRSLTSIGSRVFENCSSLVDVMIPDSVTSIGEYSFSGCENLENITISGSVVNISPSTFRNCSSLTDITIPESVISIAQGAFYNCSSITSITIPETITSLGDSAFEGCTSLKSITIPDGVTSIESSTFRNCSSLTGIRIPDSVISIGEFAFSGCNSLTSIAIPYGITSIEYEAFSGCSSLTSITIPDSVTSIEFSAFRYCSSLTNITLPDSVTSIMDYAFSACSNLTCITIPDSVTSIEFNAFRYCNRLAIIGYSGSAAEMYAIENSIPFIDINKEIISDLDVTSITAQTYTGRALKPAVTVTVNGTTLTAGTDYTLSYANNTNAGTAFVIITGEGDYTGFVTKSFTINKASQSVTAKAAASPIYVGKATTISVTGNQGTVTYSSSDTSIATVTKAGKVTGKKAGTVTISVVSAATDNYKQKTVKVTVKVIKMPAATSKVAASNKAGGINVEWKKVSGAAGYKIYRNDKLAKTITDVNTLSWGDTKATANGTKYVYKVAAYTDAGISDNTASVTIYRLDRPAISSLTNSAAGKLTVKWGKNAKATGYQIQYSTSSKFTSATTKTVTVKSNATVSKVIASLTKGKTYYVRVRSYKTVSSKKYYSMWSAVKKLKLTK